MLKVCFWIHRVDIEIVFQYVHPVTGAPLHEERVVAVRKELNLHHKVYQRDVIKTVVTLDTSC